MRKLIVPVLAVLALAAPAAASTAGGTKVAVTATEFHFALSKMSAPAGKVTFIVVNKGHISHDFQIAGKKTATIGPGKTATLVVVLKKGRYPYSCTLPGHASAGMKGTFTVT